MARKLRPVVTDIPRHVVQRGINRRATFTEFQDFHLYLKYFKEAAAETKCVVHAYVLMTNHVHLLLTPTTEVGLPDLMRRLGSRYVRYFNDRHERTGSLWEGRYRASLVKTDSYALTCMHYVEANPVRAGIVKHPRDYRWSSYRVNAGEVSDDFIVPPAAYEALASDPFVRGRLYAQHHQRVIDEAMLNRIRYATKRGEPIEQETGSGPGPDPIFERSE